MKPQNSDSISRVVDRLRDRLNLPPRSNSGDVSHGDEPADDESLVGAFQNLRPQDEGPVDFDSLFDDDRDGERLSRRLMDVFEAAGDGRRPGGGRDAYFVVRGDGGDDPDWVRARGEAWMNGLLRYCDAAGSPQAAGSLDDVAIRVLEGIPPKQPKRLEDHTAILKNLRHDVPAIAPSIIDTVDAEALRSAYYFIACDPMLRDHLMWPLFDLSHRVDEPFEGYFDLWRRGIKFRSYKEGQLDLYLPRPSS